MVEPIPAGYHSVTPYLMVRDAARATVRRPVADQFYGDRMGTLVDPYGHVWSIGTHREDVSVEEMQRRMASQQAS